MPNSVKTVFLPAKSTPISGSITGTTVQYSAAFIPELGRAMAITLDGTWAGTVQIQRSVDAKDPSDATKVWHDTTVAGGSPWQNYTTNCDEGLDAPTQAGAMYRLKITLTSGTVNYYLAQ